MGNRPNVFSKIGDSISESGSFLKDVGFGWYNLGDYTALQPTVTALSAVTFPDGTNSFNRASRSATAGWTTVDILNGGATSPLMTELHATQPAYAVIMIGTNDMDHWGVDQYRTNLQQIVDDTESLGVIPIVSTIPDRHDSAADAAAAITFNSAIRTLAATDHIPLIDFWAGLQSLPSQGVSSDGIHPTIFIGPDGTPSGGYFTAPALQFGYNLRSLTAIQMLEEVRTAVGQ